MLATLANDLLTLVFTVSTLISYLEASDSKECENGFTTFEIVSGFKFEGEAIEEIIGAENITDCLRRCSEIIECKSINFQNGFCLIYKSNAIEQPNSLRMSNFPTFTVYGEKYCLKGKQLKNKCTGRSWSHERVVGFQFNLLKFEKRKVFALSSKHCIQLCLQEQSFACRSVNFNKHRNECSLFDIDRHSITNSINYSESARSDDSEPYFSQSASDSIDYLENNCIDDPQECDFKIVKGRILNTVDNVYHNVTSFEECRLRCLHSRYRCFSFDFGLNDRSQENRICRTSHLNTASTRHIDNAFTNVPGGITYELVSCLNVTVECLGREMIAKVKSSRLFNGKVYSKSKPRSCINDVSNAMNFELKLPYNDLTCDVTQLEESTFISDIVIQYNDRVLTHRDFSLSVKCRYDMSNKTISNVPLLIDESLKYTNKESLIKSESIGSPNVSMSVLDERGNSIEVARIGDPLILKFQITDKESPFEIFIQELIAIDGNDNSEITLIDRNGCPTDTTVMSSVSKSAPNFDGKSVQATFEAFKFPSSDLVQFRALITPCLPTCKPARCVHWDYESASQRESYSFGRRKRDVESVSKDELLVVGTILIDDSNASDAPNTAQTSKHTTNDQTSKKYLSYISNKELSPTLPRNNDSRCFDVLSLILVASIFLISQLILIVIWFIIWRKTKVIRNYFGLCDYRKQWEQQQQQFLYNTVRRANSACGSVHKCRYPDVFVTGNVC